MHRGRALAGIGLASLRQRAFCLLRRRTFEQRANFSVGLAIFGRRGLWKAVKQGCCGSDVLACPGEVRVGFVVGEDPLVHIMGHGACASTIPAMLDLLINSLVFPDELLSGIIDFQLSCSQLLRPYMGGAAALPPSLMSGLAVGVASPSETLSTCPSEVSAMKHSREG